MAQNDEDLAVDLDAMRASPANLPPGARRVVVAIDRLSELVGVVLSWAALALVFVVVVEAIRRYAFNSPSIWAYDVSYMLYGAIFMLGAAATLRFRGHIRTDLFYQRWSPRTQSAVDLFFYVFFFFPGLVVFFWAGMDQTIHSFLIGENAMASPWRPILWPYRAVIPLSAFLLALQGVSECVKAWFTLTKGPAA